MMLGLGFTEPLLLMGLLATLIPVILHLLARSRAQEMPFPTLRFLRMSMEKTARRRRMQHVLLMLLRMLLFAALALAVSEPVTDAVGGWMGGSRSACVLILDNSLSMSALAGAQDQQADHMSRLDRAKVEAKALLSGPSKPALAAMVITNGEAMPTELTTRLDKLREQIDRCAASAGKAPLGQRVASAIEILAKDSTPQKSIYVFSDLQKVSFDELNNLKSLAGAKDIHLLIVNTAARAANNVGIADVHIEGRRVVDKPLKFVATLANSSQTDRVVDVALRVDGVQVGQKVRRSLRPAGKEGSTVSVPFYHAFNKVGAATGDVFIEQNDDLVRDNQRRFSLRVGGRIKALVVRGPSGDPKQPLMGPATMLLFALDPYSDKSMPWSIMPQTIESDQFSPVSLQGVDAVFFCDMPAFNAEQAKALEGFVAAGGTAALFLGPSVDVGNYNARLIQEVKGEGGLLPAKLGPAVGEVGPAAEAVPADFVLVEHPYFKGLYENPGDYLGVLVQRYYKLEETARSGKALIRLKNGSPLLMDKDFGKGRVVLCATGASPLWSNLPTTGLFVSMTIRMAMLARGDSEQDADFVADTQIAIRPAVTGDASELPISITLPEGEDGKSQSLAVQARKTAEGYLATLNDTSRVGFYRWRVAAAGDADGEGSGSPDRVGGVIAVNPNGAEVQLQAMTPEAVKQMLQAQGLSRVYVAPSVSEVEEFAEADAQKRNWWDVLLALTVVVLVVESVVANRFKKSPEAQAGAGAKPTITAA